jgi:hypothetical protein
MSRRIIVSDEKTIETKNAPPRKWNAVAWNRRPRVDRSSTRKNHRHLWQKCTSRHRIVDESVTSMFEYIALKYLGCRDRYFCILYFNIINVFSFKSHTYAHNTFRYVCKVNSAQQHCYVFLKNTYSLLGLKPGSCVHEADAMTTVPRHQGFSEFIMHIYLHRLSNDLNVYFLFREDVTCTARIMEDFCSPYLGILKQLLLNS